MQERLKRIEEAEQAKRLAEEIKQKKLQQQTQPEQPPIDPHQMFRLETDKYSKFDDNGMPTHDNDGQELTKSALKKIAKRFQAQEKKYNDYLKKVTA
ncbi:hypothetical protein BLA29_014358 [Euroglyphus maynei]|uniref:Uncharacterized protein n=1 Tax=Euroglyphus maynei TaxID=6958 RepID=A0A1Y3BFR7_EURMA|nr:hypothetical protein BLA29_014358 [Euroglyphus maynei]